MHLVEPCAKFLEEAERSLASPKATGFYCKGLQEFEFEKSYHCIWIQWVLSYLPDEDLMAFLSRCRENLEPDGLVFVKENVCEDDFVVDDEDFSVTRSEEIFEKMFELAGLQVIKKQQQPFFPEDLYKIVMYALRAAK